MNSTVRPASFFKLKWILLAVSTLLFLGWGFWIMHQHDPNTPISPFLPCMFYSFTGYYCIGCGLTRALHALAHGDIVRAFSMNPLAMTSIPAVALMVADNSGLKIRCLQPLMNLLQKPMFWLILLPSYWVARNLPWFPFTLLAPSAF